jgi:hypothetical protein
MGVDDLPGTPAIELAIAELERYAEGETELVNHSYRTFHFAELLYKQSGADIPMDRDVLAVAVLLHDVGMYPKAVAEVDGNDFTVRGSRGESGKRWVGRHTASTWPPKPLRSTRTDGYRNAGVPKPISPGWHR